MTRPDAAPFIGLSRHRMTTDGEGVVTLAAFHGCPLRCRYCLNARCLDPSAPVKRYTPDELYDAVKIDELYFLATNGGVTFGGGEPLLYPAFLTKFRALCGEAWHLCAETSLNVPAEAVDEATNCIDRFIVDIKDTNPAIYFAYTGQDNARALSNLHRLIQTVGSERVTVRLPLIKGYNTDADRDASEKLLRSLGVTDFDRFTYRVNEE